MQECIKKVQILLSQLGRRLAAKLGNQSTNVAISLEKARFIGFLLAYKSFYKVSQIRELVQILISQLWRRLAAKRF